ncbi:MAG: hypothetical protein JRN20_08220 [Nitrososphaerota archaeon]|nr:hypothetical protein [Nitrososphaerota archaeon]MDG6922350.1 hypothetical protein [Nitrososphaerota archaeon]
MVTIDVVDLEDDLKEGIAPFIEGRLPLKSEKNGNVITFEDKSPRSHVTAHEVRTLMKKYIHAKNVRKNYRVLSEKGSLKFVKQRIENDEEEK